MPLIVATMFCLHALHLDLFSMMPQPIRLIWADRFYAENWGVSSNARDVYEKVLQEFNIFYYSAIS